MSEIVPLDLEIWSYLSPLPACRESITTEVFGRASSESRKRIHAALSRLAEHGVKVISSGRGRSHVAVPKASMTRLNTLLKDWSQT